MYAETHASYCLRVHSNPQSDATHNPKQLRKQTFCFQWLTVGEIEIDTEIGIATSEQYEIWKLSDTTLAFG
jgi:hypothetical protein